MIMKNRNKNSKSRIRLSYIVMAVAVVILTDIPIFYTMARSMRQAAINNAQTVFGNVASIVDANIEKIDTFLLNLTMDTDIERYLRTDADNFTPGVIERVYAAQNKLTEIVHINQYIDSIYLYNTKNDTILTSEKGVYKREDFPDIDWMNMAGLSSGGVYVMRDKTGSKKVLTSVRGVPMIGAARDGLIAVNISDNILNAFTSLGDVAVLNSEGDVLKSTGKIDEKLLALVGDEESASRESGGRIVTWYASEYANFRYVNVIKNSDILKKLLGAVIISLLVTFVGLLFVFVIIDYMSKYMYRPIEDIMDAAGIDPTKENGEDDIKLVTGRIRKYIDDNNKLEANMHLMKSTYSDKLIRGILSGRRYTGSQLSELLSHMKFDEPDNVYRVVIIDIDSGSYSCEKIENERELWYYGIINIAEEIIGRKYAVAFCKDYEMAGIISTDATDEELSGLLIEIRDMVKKYFDISLTFALSDGVGGIENISTSYRKALEILDYKFILGGFNILTAQKAEAVKKEQLSQPELNCARVANLIKSGDTEAIVKECDDYAKKLIESGCVYTEVIITGLLRSITGIKTICGHDAVLSHDIYTRLSRSETVDELNGVLKSLFTDMTGSGENISSRHDISADRIIRYIDENYKNPDISLKMISDTIGVSVSYISTTVNSVTKTSLINYINQRRIEDAKRILIENPDIPIERVREAVGYTNVHSFIRQFKNFEGITPGKYREINYK